MRYKGKMTEAEKKIRSQCIFPKQLKSVGGEQRSVKRDQDRQEIHNRVALSSTRGQRKELLKESRNNVKGKIQNAYFIRSCAL